MMPTMVGIALSAGWAEGWARKPLIITQFADFREAIVNF